MPTDVLNRTCLKIQKKFKTIQNTVPPVIAEAIAGDHNNQCFKLPP